MAHVNQSADDNCCLQIKNLSTSFSKGKNRFRAVDDCSFSVSRGRTLGLVGESGCGKSVTSLSIMRLVRCPPGRYDSGEILFEKKNLLSLSEQEMRMVRGNRISMIFQEPMTSLNPVYTIGNQMAEVYRWHKNMSHSDARHSCIELLKLVKIPSPEKRIDDYPHQLSGGMRQRVMIAMALACEPALLIADEPTTALDVTIQAQILALMNDLQERKKMAIVLITHDLGVVAETCDDVAVMYAGKIVEKANIKQLFDNPLHPYTHGLLASIPKLGERKAKLNTIQGMVPSLDNMPIGCRFFDRCSRAMEKCKTKNPELRSVLARSGVDDSNEKNANTKSVEIHEVSCFLYQ